MVGIRSDMIVPLIVAVGIGVVLAVILLVAIRGVPN